MSWYLIDISESINNPILTFDTVPFSNLTFDMHQDTFHRSERIQNSKVFPICLTYVGFQVIFIAQVGSRVTQVNT